MKMISVDVGDGELHEYVAARGRNFRKSSMKEVGAVVALVDGEQKDMSFSIDVDCKVLPIMGDSDGWLYILRHSCVPIYSLRL